MHLISKLGASVVARALAALAIVVIAVGAAPTVAFAHADLESTDPSAGALLDAAPRQLVLRFTGAVDSVPGGIRLVAADGTDVETGAPGRFEGSTSTLAVDLPELADGTYVVAWRAVSADSHPIGGAFTFSVGTETEPVEGLVNSLLDGERELKGSSQILAAGRWASYAGIAVMAGAIATTLWMVPALSAKRTRRIVLISLGVAAVGTTVMLATQSAIAVNRWSGATDGEAWRATIESNAGQWWSVRLVAIIVVGLAGTALVRSTNRRPSLIVGWAFGACALFAAVAAGGHAISGRAVPAGFIATVVHLAAMATWIGGLVTIALTPSTSRTFAARRFSPIALTSVAALLASGVVNVWRQVGNLDGLTETSYGRWLLVKTTLIILVLAIAATTRWMILSPTSHPAEPPDTSGAENPVPVRRLVMAELSLVVLVLVATAFLVNSPPARAIAIGPASVSMVNGERIAQVTVDPARTGGTTMHVYITGPSVLDEPDEITVQISLPDRGIGPLVVAATRAGPGHVTTPDADFPLAGTWTVEIRARYGEFDLLTFTGRLTIN